MSNAILQYATEIDKVLAKYAYQLSPADREDMKQECFLALLRVEPLIKNGGHAYTICRNKAIDLLRQQQDTVSIDSREPPPDLPKAFEGVKHRELIEAINKLPLKEKNLIRLIFGIGCTSKRLDEIAEALLWNISQVRQVRDLALKKLKELLK